MSTDLPVRRVASRCSPDSSFQCSMLPPMLGSRRGSSRHRRRRSPCSRAGTCAAARPRSAVRSHPPAHVVLPHRFVDEIVEVEILHVLELGARRREQLLRRCARRVHRAADVEEQQHLDRVVPLGHHLEVEQAGVARWSDGVVEIEFIGTPLRANLRSRRSASLMLRVPSSTVSSRFLNSRFSHTLTARKLRPPSWPMRMPSGL
jgi:hypothetical protein